MKYILAVLILCVLVAAMFILSGYQNTTTILVQQTRTPEIILVTRLPEPTITQNIPNLDIPETTRKPERNLKWNNNTP
jgi:hypothetical protein